MGFFLRNNWIILTLPMNETALLSLQLKSNTTNSFVDLEHKSLILAVIIKNFHHTVVDHPDSKA